MDCRPPAHRDWEVEAGNMRLKRTASRPARQLSSVRCGWLGLEPRANGYRKQPSKKEDRYSVFLIDLYGFRFIKLDRMIKFLNWSSFGKWCFCFMAESMQRRPERLALEILCGCWSSCWAQLFKRSVYCTQFVATGTKMRPNTTNEPVDLGVSPVISNFSDETFSQFSPCSWDCGFCSWQNPWFLVSSFGDFLSHGGTHSHHPFSIGIFPYNPSSYGVTPMNMETIGNP